MRGADGMVSDPHHLRQALGRFATGVTIVTCLDRDGQRVGLTANSFNALSLDPPLILWSLRLRSPSLQAFAAASHFAVNVLGRDQLALSRHFSRSGADKFALGQWSEGAGRVPVLAGSVAQFECSQQSVQEAGDHMLFIGRVLHAREDAREPLVYHGGRYRSLGEALED
jgi:3-hydroxy-9,10-secoandrosta-1,3,5(10)-triene-9,17-dione monooxygenase reductase component